MRHFGGSGPHRFAKSTLESDKLANTLVDALDSEHCSVTLKVATCIHSEPRRPTPCADAQTREERDAAAGGAVARPAWRAGG
jgi:hypothetical protein